MANSGASTIGANFVSAAAATTAPRATGCASTSIAAVTSTATRPSLAFELATSSVNGNVAHA